MDGAEHSCVVGGHSLQQLDALEGAVGIEAGGGLVEEQQLQIDRIDKINR